MTKHVGLLSVESTSGSGTRFCLFIPVSDSSTTTLKFEKQAICSGSGNILVMDDDAVVPEAVEAMLETLGYEVELNSDGEEAIARYIAALQSDSPFD